MKVEGVQFPIPEGAVEVKPDNLIGRFFVLPGPVPAGWTWVENTLGTDTTDYEVGPDSIIMISHSTHNRDNDNKRSVVTNPSIDFERLQSEYNYLLSLIHQ